MLSHIRYHDILLQNDVTVDWLSVHTLFGTCCAPGVRMGACGLVYLLFVAQSMWCSMPEVCSAKGEWVEHGIESHKVQDGDNIYVGFRLGEAPMGHIKLLLSKYGPLLRGEVGWVRDGLGGAGRLRVLGQR